MSATKAQRTGHYGTVPTPLSKSGPEYTQEAWDEGIEGVVVLSADIGADGGISNIRVEKSLGYGLDEKAIECLRKWRFSPATHDGVPENRRTAVDILFELPDKRAGEAVCRTCHQAGASATIARRDPANADRSGRLT